MFTYTYFKVSVIKLSLNLSLGENLIHTSKRISTEAEKVPFIADDQNISDASLKLCTDNLKPESLPVMCKILHLTAYIWNEVKTMLLEIELLIRFEVDIIYQRYN